MRCRGSHAARPSNFIFATAGIQLCGRRRCARASPRTLRDSLRRLPMKAINALILSVVAGVTTFGAQHFVFPAKLHAATFTVPLTPDWRQQLVAHDPGGGIVNHMLAHLTDRLDLSADQAKRMRPLLEQQHERILTLLLTSPPTLTREQFMAERQAIIEQTHRQADA